MFLNIHSLMSILVILVYHNVKCILLSFDSLGNKDAINALHKTNHVISYSNIHMQNAAWSRMVSEVRLHFPYFSKCDNAQHMDNNHGRQETLTVSGTTHDINKTIFKFYLQKRSKLYL